MARAFESAKWVSRGALNFPVVNRDTLPRFFSGLFSGPALKLEARSAGSTTKPIPKTWRWAGTLYVSSAKGEEWGARKVRINQTVILDWYGQELDTYKVAFQPYSWLPNCRITIFKYSGVLASPCQAVADALGVTPTPGPYPPQRPWDDPPPTDYGQEDPSYDG